MTSEINFKALPTHQYQKPNQNEPKLISAKNVISVVVNNKIK